MREKIIVYGTPTCPAVPPVRGMLQRAQAEFEYISLTNNLEARRRVQAINNGNESVPTLVFSDGSTMTEPPLPELKARLEALGYRVPPATLLDTLKENPFYTILGVALLAYGVIDGGNWVFMLSGAGMLVVALAYHRLQSG